MLVPLDISVVICAYTEERWDDLVAAVASIQRQTVPALETIIVIDHNPELLDRARAAITDVTIVENKEPRGLSGARNSGIAMAQGMIIAFMDEDAMAAPDWLERLREGYTDPDVLGVGGAIEPMWFSGRPQWFPEEFDWVIGCTYRGMPEFAAPVRNLIGCNMSFRREVFEVVGGFRIGRVGALSIGQENDETEFCIRLNRYIHMARLLYQPTARVLHRVRPQRGTFAYYRRRCFSEGLSKATVSRIVGYDQGLSSERSYTLTTLPQGVVRGLCDTLFRRNLGGIERAAAIGAGFAITAWGYLLGSMLRRNASVKLAISKAEQGI